MMLKRFTYCIVFVLGITSCNNVKVPEKPKDLISKDKMVEILLDARLLGSALNSDKKIMKKAGVDLNTYVFTKHGIDSLWFAVSNNYYAYQEKDYEEIYTKLLDTLDKLKVFYKNLEQKEIKQKERKKKDSILAVKKKRDSLNALKIKKKKVK